MLTVNNRLEQFAMLCHEIGNLSNPAINPLHKGGEVVRLVHSAAGQFIVTGQATQGIIFGQQMNHTACLVFTDKGSNQVCHQTTGQCIPAQFQPVRQVGSNQAEEAAQFIRATESGFQLIFHNGNMIPVYAGSHEVSLENIRLFDRPLINSTTVTAGGNLSTIIGHRVIVCSIICEITVSNRQFTHIGTPTIPTLFQTGKPGIVGPDREDRPAQYISDRVHHGIITGTDCGLSN